MKTTKTIGLILLITLMTSASYWLGYRHGRSPARLRINTVGSLRQVALSFSGAHNDITRFSATGSITTPKAQTPE